MAKKRTEKELELFRRSFEGLLKSEQFVVTVRLGDRHFAMRLSLDMGKHLKDGRVAILLNIDLKEEDE
jgi:hypothetical protein